MRGKKLIGTAAAVAVIAGICGTGSCWRQEISSETRDKLNIVKEEKRQDLKDARGTYNDASIVLADTTKTQAERIAKKIGARVRLTSNEDYAVLYLPEDVTIEDIYNSEDYVEYLPDMEPDYYVSKCEVEAEKNKLLTSRPEYDVQDEFYAQQTYLDYIHMGDSWSASKGSGIKVAIIDTGIDTDNLEFAGRISDLSYNASQDKTVKSYGMDVIEDEDGHGTSVAGVLAAAMDQTGITGIAPEAEMIVIKCDTDSNGDFIRSSDLVFGLAYAIECDADVVNMSFSTSENIFSKYTKLAADSDVICVAAAGNEGSTMLSYPAADENVIGVGALENNGWERADYSNYGDNIEILAPGSAYTTLKDGSYGIANGTSVSAPVVTGAIALYLAENPHTGFSDMEAVIQASSVDLGVLGKDWQHGFGALDIHALVREEKGTITYEMLTDELENTTQIFVKGHTIQSMPEPERENQALDGWFYDDQATDECGYYTDTFTDDVTLYAGWINEDDGSAWIYTVLPDDTVEITSYTGKRRYLTVPGELEGKKVTSLGEGAFSGNNRIRQINLPDTLSKISDRAMYNCNSLREIEIPESVEEIGKNAFYGCVHLTKVEVAENGRLQRIMSGAFSMSGITELMIAENVTDLADDAFYGSTNLKNITVSSKNKTFQLKNDALYNRNGDILLYYPAAKGGNYQITGDTVQIGNNAFAYTKCKNIGIPEGVESFGENCFVYSQITKIEFPASIKKFGKKMFYNSQLTTVTFASDQKADTLEDDMFSFCQNLNEIEIPKNIENLGINTFAYSSLRRVSFAPGSVMKNIGSKAFSYCPIEEFQVPDGVEIISSYMFYFCQQLKKLEFGVASSCSRIDAYAFSMCPNLEKIELPSRLTTIGANAFWGCSATEIKIGKGITRIEPGAFSHCTSLEILSVDPENKVYTAENGILFNKDKTELLIYPAGRTENYQLPDGVKKIADSAFAGAGIEAVIFNDALTEIGQNAFSECAFMKTPVLPESLITIGENAFAYCASFKTEMQIPKNVTSIGRFAFLSDYNLKKITIEADSCLDRIAYGTFAYCGIEDFTIPENVSSIGQEAFIGCTSLITVTFEAESRLENLAAWTFSGAEELRQITFEKGSHLKSIEARALDGMTKLQRITLENCQELKVIGNYAFKNCMMLTEIMFPESLQEIGRYAFSGCAGLTRLDIPEKVDRIGRYAFLKDSNLRIYFKVSVLPVNLEENWDYDILAYYLGSGDITRSGDWEYILGADGLANITAYLGSDESVVLSTVDGYKVASIGTGVFADNVSLKEIRLPETLTGIYQNAFSGTTALKMITIPSSVKVIDTQAFKNSGICQIVFEPESNLEIIGNSAFAQTADLQEIQIPAKVNKIRERTFYKSGIHGIQFEDGAELEEIGRYAFSESAISEIEIAETVKKVDYYAFSKTEQLQTVHIGDVSDMRIMGNAFYGSGLKAVTLPEGVSYLGEFCFSGCKNLLEIQVAEGNAHYASSDGVLFNKEKTKLITCPAGKTGSYNVPDTVLAFMSGAFEWCSLNEIHMSEQCKLQTLGYRTFYNCNSLKKIDIPDSILSIESYAFAYCDNLEEVNIGENSQLGGIYKGAFYKDEKLMTISIPSGVLEIGDYAFYGCTGINAIQFGETVNLKRISEHAFEYAGVTSFTMPESLDEIGDYAFHGAELKNIEFNNGITSIGGYAFADCGLSDMTVMTMPDSIEYLGISALKGADSIEEITVPFVGVEENAAKNTGFADLFGGEAKNIRKVTVLKGKVLGKSAFDNSEVFNNHGIFDRLEEVILPEELQEIGESAFRALGTLKTVRIPDSVEKIDDFAFANSGVEKINLPQNLKMIGAYSFYQMLSLKEVHFNDRLEKIGDLAFNECSQLQMISLPKSLKSIGNAVFSGCTELRSVEIDEANKWYSSINGILYNKECTEVIYVPAGLSGMLVIPEGITEIPQKLAENCINITEIQFPNSLISIGDMAFYGCAGLKHVTIPESVKKVGSMAFAECTGLKSAEIQAKLTALGSMFFHCSSLNEIIYPDTIENLGELNGCESLEQIIIGDSIKNLDNVSFCYNLKKVYLGDNVKIGDENCFGYCPKLTDISVSPKNPYYMVKDGCLYSKDGRTLLVVPKNKQGTFVVEDGVEKINSYCFSDCRDISRVVLPDSVTYVGQSAFQTCENLKQITLGHNIRYIGRDCVLGTAYRADQSKWENGILYIGEYAIEGSDITGECNIKQGTRLIGEWAFSNQEGIRRVYLPDTVRYVNGYAFYNCTGLEYIKLGNYVKEVGEGAFYGCYSLWSMAFPESIEQIDSQAVRCGGLRYVSWPLRTSGVLLDVSSVITCLKIPSISEEINRFEGNGKISDYVLTDSVALTGVSFTGISGSRIFIKASEQEDLPYGWNNGNEVHYEEEWHLAEFYADGILVQMTPLLNSEILQSPAMSVLKNILPAGAQFAGWDIDGDGLVDELPVTLSEDIHAEAVYNVDITNISLDETLIIEKGDTRKLEVKYTPAHYTVENGVSFSSSDELIVKVDSDGMITGVGEGTAKVTVVLEQNPSVEAGCEVSVVEPSYGIKLNRTSGFVNVGETLQLEPEVNLPELESEFAEVPVIVWKSEDETIATVTDGLIEGIAPGTTTITAECGEYSAQLLLQVYAPLKEISMDVAELEMNAGETQKLKVNYAPINTTDDTTVTWFSTKTSVASVDDTGLVTAVGPGNAKIKATMGTKIVTCEVSVKAPLKWIKLNTTTGTMRLNRTKQMEIIYEPSDTTDDKTAIWSSSDPSVALVNEDGVVTAVSRGTATITAKVGNFSSTYDVTVIGLRDETTGITVTNSDDTEMRAEISLQVKDVKKENQEVYEGVIDKVSALMGEKEEYNFSVYDIALLENGQTVQPTTTVDVEIPMETELPHEAFVYRVEADGSLKDMGVACEKEYYSFETAHFSTYILGLKHSWGLDAVEEIPATCLENGSKTYKCIKCDASKIEVLPAFGHKTKETAEIPATCTEPGRTAGVECEICGAILSGEEEIPALGHDYGSWSVVKAPTYTENGEEQRICSRDSSHVETRELPVLGIPLSECQIQLLETTYVYDGKAKEPKVMVYWGTQLLTENTDYQISYSNNINAGTATVTITAKEDGKYTGTVSLNYVIKPVPEENSVVIQPNAFSNCSNLVNVNIKDTVKEIGDLAFADCKNLLNVYFAGNCPKFGKDVFKNVRITAYYPYNDTTWSLDKLQGYGGNVTWLPWNPRTQKPEKRDLTQGRISIERSSYIYDGTAKTPKVTIADGTYMLSEGRDYTVTYSDNVNAGTATVIVTGKGTYGGSYKTSFTIQRAENQIQAADITLTTSTKAKKVSLSARANGNAVLTYTSSNKSVKVNQNGMLTIPKNFVGQATITINAAETPGYKAASSTITVLIRPTATSLVKLTNSGKGKLTVTWKKNKKVSGYKLQYSTDKTFKTGVKSVTVKKAAMVKKTLSKLKKGKKYYVRISTYKTCGKTKIYSSWSKAKTVKIRK